METYQHQRKTKNRKVHKARIITTRRLSRTCAVCGKGIAVILHNNIIQRGGHYFGKIGIHSQREMNRALKLGTRKVRIFNKIVNVLKEDPKPYKYAEYWECPKCFR